MQSMVYQTLAGELFLNSFIHSVIKGEYFSLQTCAGLQFSHRPEIKFGKAILEKSEDGKYFVV